MTSGKQDVTGLAESSASTDNEEIEDDLASLSHSMRVLSHTIQAQSHTMPASKAEEDAVDHVSGLFDVDDADMDEQPPPQRPSSSRRSTGASRSASRASQKKRPSSEQQSVASVRSDERGTSVMSNGQKTGDAVDTRPVSHSGRPTEVISQPSLHEEIEDDTASLSRSMQASKAEEEDFDQVLALFDVDDAGMDESSSRRSSRASRSVSSASEKRPAPEQLSVVSIKSDDAESSGCTKDAHATRPVSHSGRPTEVISQLSTLEEIEDDRSTLSHPMQTSKAEEEDVDQVFALFDVDNAGMDEQLPLQRASSNGLSSGASRSVSSASQTRPASEQRSVVSMSNNAESSVSNRPKTGDALATRPVSKSGRTSSSSTRLAAATPVVCLYFLLSFSLFSASPLFTSCFYDSVLLCRRVYACFVCLFVLLLHSTR